MNKGDERRSRYSIEDLKVRMENSTDAVNWYVNTEIDGASVRGPWGRWFVVKDVEGDSRLHVCDAIRDAEYAAASMNSLPHLVERIESLEQKLALAKEFIGGIPNAVENYPHEIANDVSDVLKQLSEQE